MIKNKKHKKPVELVQPWPYGLFGSTIGPVFKTLLYTHLFYVDDLNIFSISSNSEVSCIKKSLDKLSSSSSKFPNSNKPLIYLSGNTLSQSNISVLRGRTYNIFTWGSRIQN